jgi:hypothetical protein
MMSKMMKKMSKGKMPKGQIPDELLNNLKWKDKNVKNKTINRGSKKKTSL